MFLRRSAWQTPTRSAPSYWTCGAGRRPCTISLTGRVIFYAHAPPLRRGALTRGPLARLAGAQVQRVPVGDALFVVYDAGGHAEYQRMLRPFFSSGALYLLLWDGSAAAPPVEALRGWAVSIQACAPGASVLLVATHADCAPGGEAGVRARGARAEEHLRHALAQQRAGLQRELRALEPQLRLQLRAPEWLPEGEDARARRLLELLVRQRREVGVPPSPLELRAGRLLRLLDAPLRLLGPHVVTSARTLLGVEELKRRLLEAAHDEAVRLRRVLLQRPCHC